MLPRAEPRAVCISRITVPDAGALKMKGRIESYGAFQERAALGGAERFHDTETDRAKKWPPIMLEDRTDSKAGGGLSRGIDTRSRELRKRPKRFSL